MKPDAEWVRLEESWTAATETPWKLADDDPFKQEWTDGYSGAGPDRRPDVWMLGAIIAALIVAVAWLAWTR